MDSEFLIIREYCIKSRIEPDFIVQLEGEGLIQISIIDDEQYIHVSQLKEIEQYARWYYDLSINVEGIDVIRNLLDRIENMQSEILRMREQIRLIN